MRRAAERPNRWLRNLAGVLVALALGVGCGPSRRTTVVLLPEADGSVGRVAVSTPAGVQVLSRPFETTAVRSPGAAPTPPARLDSVEVERRFGPVLTAQPPAPLLFVLPFREGSAELTEEGLVRLAAVREAARGFSAPEMTVVGHTDTQGDAQVNHRLGLERARRVAGALVAAGVDPAAIEVDSHGEGNPLVPTADGVPEPRNRRVEVVLR